MRVLMLGLNHRTADLSLRERLAFDADRANEALESLRRVFPQAEAALVSTCNRTELYLAKPVHDAPDREALQAWLAQHVGLEPHALDPAMVSREQLPAVHHLMRVCAGLDSMVLGETQIQGQVRRAYTRACDAGAVGPGLHLVFQRALLSAKQTRLATGLDVGRRSVASVAVDFARNIFRDFSEKTVVALGAGEMMKLAMAGMLREQPGQAYVANRSPERAAALCAQLGLHADGPGPTGGPRPLEDLDALLTEADVVLTGTGSAEPIVRAETLKRIRRPRKGRPLFLLDLALPRDVEPAVGGLPNVYLHDLDDLRQVLDQHDDRRSAVTEDAERRLAEDAKRCLHDLQNRDLGKLVGLLKSRLHDLGQEEAKRTARKIAAQSPRHANDPEAAAALEDLLGEHTHRLVNKLLHEPLRQLRQAGHDAGMPTNPNDSPQSPQSTPPQHGDEAPPPLGFYAAALRRLFALEPQSDQDDPGETVQAEKTSPPD